LSNPSSFFYSLPCFLSCFSGANDVANAFGTTVGAKALTLKQVIVVAAIFEFGGAVLLGSGVTDTIKSGIAKVSAYTYEPELLMYGMVCALLAAGLWLALATFLELPVSTTHSIVGAIIGMSMVAAGPDSVVWYTAPNPGAGSPFPGGVVSIILAWFITPAMAAVIAALLFLFTKMFVLKAKEPFKRSLILFPLYTFITVWIITFFVIQKGVNGWMKNEDYSTTSSAAEPENPACPPGGSGGKYSNTTSGDEITIKLTGCQINDGTAAWISTVTAAVVAVLMIAGLKLVVKLVNSDEANAVAADAALETRNAALAAGGAEAGVSGRKVTADGITPDGSDEETAAAAAAALAAGPNHTPDMLKSMRISKMWTSLASGANVDVHACIDEDEKLKALHGEAELFDRKTEFSFKYLQVLTACANSFAHGANDVANAIGSMATVYSIWQCACASSKAAVPIWMFVIGGVGIVLGLATYGYKIIRALGVKMTKLTNSRGYCAELTAAIVVIVASRYGFPVSTTQVITGAITGVGISEVIAAKMKGEKNASGRFNFKLLLKFFLGWIATVIIAALTAAAFTAQGIFAPSKQQTDYRAVLNKAYNETNVGMAATLMAPANATDTPTPEQQIAFEAGELILNATKLTWNSNNATMLDTNYFMSIFEGGTWALGNASEAGVVVPATFMPVMPDNPPINFS
jgi:sodium-dependent phosphate transporter